MQYNAPSVLSPWFCPKCGKKLVLKEGRYGRFMACPGYPDCEFTRALWTYQGIKPHCEKCDATGLLPFVKNDKIIPYAFVDCACKEQEPYHHQPMDIGEFDFPCSYSWRAYYSETNGGSYLPPLEVTICDDEEETETPQLPISYQQAMKRVDKVLAESRYWHNKTVDLLKSNLDKKRTPIINIDSIILDNEKTDDEAKSETP